MTRIEDAEVAVKAGADAVGLVFYPASPRHVTIQNAAIIAASIPAFVTLVGLFVDPDPEQVVRTLNSVPIDLLQFHGDESDEFCSQFGRNYIKALRVSSLKSLTDRAFAYPNAKALLLDSYQPGLPGGTGVVFDWEMVPEKLPLPLILAGGLSLPLIEAAITKLKPWALDVSSGVESEKGVKDPTKIINFIEEVRRVDCR